MQKHEVLPFDTSTKQFLADRTQDNFIAMMESFAFCYYNERVVRVPVQLDEDGKSQSIIAICAEPGPFFPIVTQYGTDDHPVQTVIKLKYMVSETMKETGVKGICINPWDNKGVLLAKSIIGAMLDLFAGMKFVYSEITSRSFFHVVKFAEQEGMCTNPKAPSEDLMPFSFLTTVQIGHDDLKKMVEAVTEEEIDIENHNWLDAFECVTHVLDNINPNCPLYRRFKEYRPSGIFN